jgi:molybdenum cofactor cytidylyltransferase
VLPAIILAAGDSTRMGSPKALLRDPSGQTFIGRIAATLRTAGLTDIIIVTGRHHDDIAQALAGGDAHRQVRLARNEDPSRGQLSSLWTGLDACPADASGVVVTLVDVPFVTAETVRGVIEAWSRTGAPIVRPAYRERRGHPVIFDERLFVELRGTALEAGARAVVSAHYQEIVNVEVDDPGCVVDVDTPSEYRQAIETGFGIPSAAPDASRLAPEAATTREGGSRFEDDPRPANGSDLKD